MPFGEIGAFLLLLAAVFLFGNLWFHLIEAILIVPFAESRFLMTGIFIYHICFITLSKSTICQGMTNQFDF